MVSVVGWVLYAVVLAGHTLLAAVTTRFFRVRMKTRWGWLVYASLVTPFLLVVTTLIVGQALPPLGTTNRLVVLALLVGVPFALGFTIDLLYVPAPEEYDLPDTPES